MEELRSIGNAEAVTPSDSTALSGVRAVYVGGAGDLAVRFPGNPVSVVFASVAAGSMLDIKPEYIMSTDTTATNIVACY